MKKSASAGALSGCIVFAIVFGAIGTCLLPVAGMVGGFTSSSDLAVRTVGGFECPKGTTPKIYSYDTTSTDENGFTVPATAYELHCMDSGGNVVKNDPVAFAFIWIGILAAVGLVIAIILSILFAAPAGVFIGRLFNRSSSPNKS